MPFKAHIDPFLTRSDTFVIKNLLNDIGSDQGPNRNPESQVANRNHEDSHNDQATVHILEALNEPKNERFEPTVFVSVDLQDVQVPLIVDRYLLQPYIRVARTIVRTDTDVVLLTHLILYFSTSVPSAVYLFYSFSWIHAVLHWLMQSYYVGSYTLMMHQHIHGGGILAKKYAWFDASFPYILDPLLGHTWNSYFYHHIKHHHVEGNGPDDLSSTLRYQRDDIFHFMHYIGRFFFLIWFDLPRYFLRKNRPKYAMKAAFFELGNYAVIYYLASYISFRATLFVFILPLLMLRVGLMVGNFGQHAFVDEEDPNSDFRSSITLIDVPSNRYCFNDGYHTSHHLNPRRHWREHPVSFIKMKDRYANEGALVFRNIDYIMITVNLMRKNYMHLAECLVPMGAQIGMSLEEKAEMLQSKTRSFTEEEIAEKFSKKAI